MKILPVSVAVAGALLVGACSGSSTNTTGTDGEPAVSVDQAELSPSQDVPSALDDPFSDDLPEPLVEPGEIISGGPPPDGIPPIDDPKFLSPDAVDFLEPDEPVLAIEIDGEARAYPVQIMIWHEIVNDTIAGVPVSVTYCPLCNSAVAVDRRVDDQTLDFGTSGSLYQSSLVMYDRQTESLWSHFTGEALAGVFTGTELERLPVATVSWQQWLDANPDGLVLSRDTGASRDYGRNPYPGYDDVDEQPFLFDGEIDGRLAAKQRVVAVGRDTDPTAIRSDELLEAGVIPLTVDGVELVAWAVPGTSSALDSGQVDEGRDVGATGVFEATVDGRTLTFERSGDGFTDVETASTWNILGLATDGELAGTQLSAVPHLDTFWFAWAAFAPDTTVVP